MTCAVCSIFREMRRVKEKLLVSNGLQGEEIAVVPFGLESDSESFMIMCCLPSCHM